MPPGCISVSILQATISNDLNFASHRCSHNSIFFFCTYALRNSQLGHGKPNQTKSINKPNKQFSIAKSSLSLPNIFLSIFLLTTI